MSLSVTSKLSANCCNFFFPILLATSDWLPPQNSPLAFFKLTCFHPGKLSYSSLVISKAFCEQKQTHVDQGVDDTGKQTGSFFFWVFFLYLITDVQARNSSHTRQRCHIWFCSWDSFIQEDLYQVLLDQTHQLKTAANVMGWRSNRIKEIRKAFNEKINQHI